MATKIDELKKEVLQLTSHERAIIALSLIRSLDDQVDGTEDELEKIWVQEVKKRYNDYKQGKTKLKPAEQVFHEARLRKQ
jgi:putative addiction module component (TIGR02574 family)